jgi:hypothetical protein
MQDGKKSSAAPASAGAQPTGTAEREVPLPALPLLSSCFASR